MADAHAFLGQAAHFEQPRLELFELFLEMWTSFMCLVVESAIPVDGLSEPSR